MSYTGFAGEDQEREDCAVVLGQRGPQHRPVLPPQGEARQLLAAGGSQGETQIQTENRFSKYVYNFIVSICGMVGWAEYPPL